MLDHKIWTCPPQVKDLSRDTTFRVTCRNCGAHSHETVQSLIETHHLGVEYVDLLEWKYRCQAVGCDGMVSMTCDGVGVSEAYINPPALKPQALTVQPLTVQAMARAKMPERLSYPSKAVVKPRLYEPTYGAVKVPARARRQAPLPLFA
jgi:hypothetical protein